MYTFENMYVSMYTVRCIHLRILGFRTIGSSDYWAFGLQTIGSSDYRAFGLLGLRTIGPTPLIRTYSQLHTSNCIH